jgi:hypothetical protein
VIAGWCEYLIQEPKSKSSDEICLVIKRGEAKGKGSTTSSFPRRKRSQLHLLIRTIQNKLFARRRILPLGQSFLPSPLPVGVYTFNDIIFISNCGQHGGILEIHGRQY